ncbi:hypothetical protein [Bradyrhizobium sp. USDA 3315]
MMYRINDRLDPQLSVGRKNHGNPRRNPDALAVLEASTRRPTDLAE